MVRHRLFSALKRDSWNNPSRGDVGKWRGRVSRFTKGVKMRQSINRFSVFSCGISRRYWRECWAGSKRSTSTMAKRWHYCWIEPLSSYCHIRGSNRRSSGTQASKESIPQSNLAHSFGIFSILFDPSALWLEAWPLSLYTCRIYHLVPSMIIMSQKRTLLASWRIISKEVAVLIYASSALYRELSSIMMSSSRASWRERGNRPFVVATPLPRYAWWILLRARIINSACILVKA